jgi:uncharacterized protein (TIGR02266 family)
MANKKEKRRFPRAPYETEVRIEFADVDEMMRECSANLSLGGMFINRVSPLPVGTAFRFRICAANDNAAISGRAVVSWVRHEDLSPSQKAGMGVRFTQLDNDSQQLIFEIVDRYIQEASGEPFKL